MQSKRQHDEIFSPKTNFKPFKIGTVFNRVENLSPPSKLQYREVVVQYPTRLYAMSFDPGKIANNNNLKYTPGSLNFCTSIFKTITVRATKDKEIVISSHAKRPTLMKHAALLMQTALGFDHGLFIDVEEEIPLRHCGLGSSSGMIAAVACSINELYGNPIPRKDLIKYVAQNHGEEIDGDNDYLSAVQCVGGSAACGMYEGGLLVLAGENCVVQTMTIPEDYDVVIGVPKNFTYPDAHSLMKKEIKNLHKYRKTGAKYGKEIAYRFFHDCLPDMVEGSLQALGDLIYDYRFRMGSIENDSFVYPEMIDLANSVAFLKQEGFADVLSTSSNGPGMFAITKQSDVCEEVFKKNGMVTVKTKIYNESYKILQRDFLELTESSFTSLN